MVRGMNTHQIAHLSKGDTKKRRALVKDAIDQWDGVKYMDSGIECALDAVKQVADHLLVVQEPRGALMGALSYNREYPGACTMRVSHIGVLEKRAGLGSLLMRRLAGIAADRGCGVRLYALDNAVPFFERIGMRERRENSHTFYEYTRDEAFAFAHDRSHQS
jgi:GNAT superfamily N-acetyltransferase